MLHFFARRLNELHIEDRKGEKGFTLIELLVVVIIIGILAAIAIPTFLAQRANALDRAAQAQLRSAGTAQQAAFTETGSYKPVTPGPGTNDDITDFGFRQGDPQVTGGGSGNTYCMAAQGGNGSFKITPDDGRPVPGTCGAS